METQKAPVSETKVSPKEILSILRPNSKNFYSFANLLLEDFVSDASTLSKKKLLQNLFCNDDFEIEIPLYYKLAKLLKQEIDIGNIKFNLKNTIKLKDGIVKVINSIKFLVDQKEKEIAKELFDLFVNDVIINNQELEEDVKQLQINKFKNEFPELI